jgi:hypothetical protein
MLKADKAFDVALSSRQRSVQSVEDEEDERENVGDQDDILIPAGVEKPR